MKFLKWIALVTGVLAVVIAALLAWTVTTQSGARFAARTVSNVLGARLEFESLDGAIIGPLTLHDIHYLNPAAGVDVRVERLLVDVRFRELPGGVVRVRALDVDGVDVLLHQPEEQLQPPEEEPQPFSLDPPIDIVVDGLNVKDLQIRRGDVSLLQLTRASFAGHWTNEDLAIEQLDVRSPQGEVTFAGRVAQRDNYVGEGRGRFRWRVGERTFAGALTSVAEAEDASLTVNLASPLAAKLEVFLEQKDAWPWRFTLEAPRFDPRKELLPDSGLQSLAASLAGEGALDRGVINGRLLVNDEPLILDPLRFKRGDERIDIETVLRIADSPGSLTALVAVHFAEETATSAVRATWEEIALPAAWVGQELHTAGRIAFRGNAEKYTAEGGVSIGPPNRTADIVLQLEGEPSAIVLRQLDVVQARGKFAATGRILFKPQLSWSAVAEAEHFDPGAFAVAWPGDLNFNLASEGRITAKGPSAALRLDNLSGELRGRALSGSADVALSPELALSGALRLASGESEVRFRGEPGDQINANVSVNIASLNDWVPDWGGELKAAFVARGRWPELSIEGDARGRDLNAADVRVQGLRLVASIDDPRNPEGSVQLDLTELSVAGFEFADVSARASGGPDAHRLTLDADGSPLAFDLALQGARSQKGWSGALSTLALKLENAVHLKLREPVRIAAEGGGFETSQACLQEGDIELCASGASQPDGALHVSYSLASVPLELAEAFAGAEAPIKAAGVLQGRGDIRRTAEGEWRGDALIESPSGRLSRHVMESESEAKSEPQTLLSWRDLQIAANLAGENARASVSARLEENGVIEGEANVRALGAAESPVQGRIAASVPDLAPLAVFAPQLANVQGRMDARFDVAGTVQEPQLTGEMNATGLAADVPAVGLHLTNGTLSAKPTPTREIRITGEVESGDGNLALHGAVNADGSVDLSIAGDRFLAADIPGARVFVTPDLDFTRADERMRLTGTVRIPEAAVDLQKLPRGGDRAQKASPDVVVIDAKTREEQTAEAPFYAEVTVVLGEEVELSGFGLQAEVDGRLEIREAPGEPTVGSGQIRVAGAYKAYGQDLTIQQGQLSYAATPLDNPQLNIEATREVGEVTAGLRVRGSAQTPELTVFSDPAMGQADALSYLVAGKPLEDIGSEEAEGDALQAATRSLGTAAGGLLAKNLGRRLGVDEVAVKDDEMIGGAALTVGQYLSPRVYLSYGIGLFEPGDVITLRYKLSEELAVQTQRGPEDTRAGIEYRIEK